MSEDLSSELYKLFLEQANFNANKDILKVEEGTVSVYKWFGSYSVDAARRVAESNDNNE